MTPRASRCRAQVAPADGRGARRRYNAAMSRPRPLTKAALEDLSDARLLLETASHNLRALSRGKLEELGPEADVDQALANAQAQIEQVLATVGRVRAARGG
jgi:hypothetical protein